jgi:hypothetical protein
VNAHAARTTAKPHVRGGVETGGAYILPANWLVGCYTSTLKVLHPKRARAAGGSLASATEQVLKIADTIAAAVLGAVRAHLTCPIEQIT